MDDLRSVGTTMLRLSRNISSFYVERFGDLANLAIGALSFGQFLGDEPFSFGMFAGGIVVWCIFTASSLWILRQEQKHHG